jgi:hypothetical protein
MLKRCDYAFMSDESAHDRNVRAAERQHDLNTDLSKLLVEASTRDAQEAIKIAFLINSGAAVAILAFIASLAARSCITTLANLKAVIHSLYWFIGGIILACITSVFAYICNSLYGSHLDRLDKIWEHPYVRENAGSRRMLRWAKGFNLCALALGVLALLVFIRGVFVAGRAFEKLVATG